MLHDLYSRLIAITHLGFYKALLALVIATFTPIAYSLMILYILMGIDLGLGVWKGVSFQSFSSKRLRMGLGKIILYAIGIVAVRLLEQQIHAPNTMLTDTLIIFLSITELISIIETLVLLGVPIPSEKIIKMITDNIKIDGIHFSCDKEINKNIEEINKIRLLNVPAIPDKATREMVEAKVGGLEEVIKQINAVHSHNQKPSDFAMKVKLALTSEMKIVEREIRNVTTTIER